MKDDFSEELQSHLDLHTADNRAGAVALLACAIPALRAARVNPSALLRGD